MDIPLKRSQRFGSDDDGDDDDDDNDGGGDGGGGGGGGDDDYVDEVEVVKNVLRTVQFTACIYSATSTFVA